MTPELTDPLEAALAWHGSGKGVALATVVATWGSSPRPVGSQLAIADDGAFLGSVSGGCVEAAVVEAGVQAIADARPRLLEFGVSQERAWALGLACGGQIQIHVQPLSEPASLTALLAARQARRPVALVTDLASGAWTLMPLEGQATGGPPGSAPPPGGHSGLRETDRGRVFVHVFTPSLRLVIVGAVHIAQLLAPMAQLAGYEVIVVDPRSAFATAERFPAVRRLGEWPDVALERLALDRYSAVVTLTHDPKLDDPALGVALRSPCFYIGSLGSRKTHAARLARLANLGFTEADLARIQGPVGLAIGARSPAEIAIAILAQLTQVLRLGAPHPRT